MHNYSPFAIMMFRPLELLPSPPMERASFFDEDDNNEDDDPIITAPSSLSPSLEITPNPAHSLQQRQGLNKATASAVAEMINNKPITLGSILKQKSN